MTFRPLHDRVLVRRLEEEEKTAGGIIIPDTAKEKPMQGEVLAVGPGARDEAGKLVPLDVRKGDRVLFGKWSGTEVKIDGQELLIMKDPRDAPEVWLFNARRGSRMRENGAGPPNGIRPLSRTAEPEFEAKIERGLPLH
jgi:chaperonin GroES